MIRPIRIRVEYEERRWYVEISDGCYRQESGGPTIACTLAHVVENWRRRARRHRRVVRLCPQVRS